MNKKKNSTENLKKESPIKHAFVKHFLWSQEIFFSFYMYFYINRVIITIFMVHSIVSFIYS